MAPIKHLAIQVALVNTLSLGASNEVLLLLLMSSNYVSGVDQCLLIRNEMNWFESQCAQTCSQYRHQGHN